jgi:hypothetical protein
MKFALTQSLFWDAFGKRNSKILKIVWAQTTLPKTGLAPGGPVRPLGVKFDVDLWVEVIKSHKQQTTGIKNLVLISALFLTFFQYSSVESNT